MTTRYKEPVVRHWIYEDQNGTRGYFIPHGSTDGTPLQYNFICHRTFQILAVVNTTSIQSGEIYKPIGLDFGGGSVIPFKQIEELPVFSFGERHAPSTMRYGRAPNCS